MALDRRSWMRNSALAVVGASASGWMPTFAGELAANPRRTRRCILLWMTGGPSQIDTFDMKPGQKTGGEFKEIDTAAPGVRFSEHLPRMAKWANELAIVRSLSTKEGDHGRGTFLARTGRQQGGPIRYPSIGSVLAKELADDAFELPSYVSIAPYRVFSRDAFGAGFLGPRWAPLTVGAADDFAALQQSANQPDTYATLGVDDLKAPESIDRAQADARMSLWQTLQGEFLAKHGSAAPITHDTVYHRAVRMMRSSAAGAFDLSQEPDTVREAYGKGRFGQGCLMARRLIERGVPFVEVSMANAAGAFFGWDTHQRNFDGVKALSGELDVAWSALMRDLKERGLLEETTILWIGEFGRTPIINVSAGRDHYPKAWCCVMAGGGIRGGQVYGRTSQDGTTVEENQTDVPHILATLCAAVGVDPKRQNMSEVGRPIRLADAAPIAELLS